MTKNKNKIVTTADIFRPKNHPSTVKKYSSVYDLMLGENISYSVSSQLRTLDFVEQVRQLLAKVSQPGISLNIDFEVKQKIIKLAKLIELKYPSED